VILVTDVSAGTPGWVISIGTRNDADSWLPRDATPAQFDVAIRAVAVGLRVSPRDEPASFAALDELHSPVLLTPRETQVLAAAAGGMSNKEIARELGISLHTVKFHLESLTRKLDASGRTEAVAKGIALGLLRPIDL